ncbi:MAG: hypothetical protein LBN07_00365 [Christensenellaceae bacterium]|jgi:hypothetical protein|nr:hypothetical protein [Christensenellaceae bacterium]
MGYMETAEVWPLSTRFGETHVVIKNGDEHKALTEAAYGNASEADYNFAMYVCDRNHNYFAEEYYKGFKHKLKCCALTVVSALGLGLGVLYGEHTTMTVGAAGTAWGVFSLVRAQREGNAWINLMQHNINTKAAIFEENPGMKEFPQTFPNQIILDLEHL